MEFNTSTHIYVFMVWCLIKYKDNLKLAYLITTSLTGQHNVDVRMNTKGGTPAGKDVGSGSGTGSTQPREYN
jgi:hypothetical protein